jgi:hypothetical protein
MKTGDIYGGNYLKAEDLKDRGDVNVLIESVSIMEGDDGKKKAVLHFRGKDKTLPLNVTNANMVEELLNTDETDDWIGRRICLYTCKVDFQGKRVLAIRVKAASNGQPAARTPPPPPPPSEPVQELTDDDIPFAWLLPLALPLTGMLSLLS